MSRMTRKGEKEEIPAVKVNHQQVTLTGTVVHPGTQWTDTQQTASVSLKITSLSIIVFIQPNCFFSNLLKNHA